TGLAVALLAAGTLLWVIFLPPVLRRWPIATAGTDLLVCVVPQALAVLAARLARVTSQRWELYAAATAFALGLVAYGMTVRRFDLRQILTGAGDQWVLAGALAISALAGAELEESALVAPRPRPGARCTPSPSWWRRPPPWPTSRSSWGRRSGREPPSTCAAGPRSSRSPWRG
ncbi:MAG TPA: hypothetical protein VE198_22460, partial [Actinoallomurus sp.]|nr:hypothetical protein [Actinoallomurus sp.]